MTKQAIFVIVPSGNAELVIKAAEDAGSSGGTIIHARGRGGEMTRSFLAIEVEPEREIVFIVTEESETAKISKAIYCAMNLSIKGQGLLFVLPLARVEGLASVSAD